MSAYELAQLNVGIIRGPMDSPLMAQFAANLARINALADASPGFVWRLQTEAGDATALRPFEKWTIRSVPRAQNAHADALVNQALDAG